MNLQEIRDNLCYYDPRNYNGAEEETTVKYLEAKKEGCYCDNCFYSRTELAEKLFELLEKGKNFDLYYKGVKLNKKPLTRKKAEKEVQSVIMNYGYKPEIEMIEHEI